MPVVEMDAETIKAGKCLEAQEFEAAMRKSCCRWRAINRPRKDPGVGRCKKRLWVLNERQSDQGLRSSVEGAVSIGGGKSRDDRVRCALFEGSFVVSNGNHRLLS